MSSTRHTYAGELITDEFVSVQCSLCTTCSDLPFQIFFKDRKDPNPLRKGLRAAQALARLAMAHRGTFAEYSGVHSGPAIDMPASTSAPQRALSKLSRYSQAVKTLYPYYAFPLFTEFLSVC